MASELQKQLHERKMEEWRYNYPLAAAFMQDRDIKPKEAVKLMELGNERRSKNGK